MADKDNKNVRGAGRKRTALAWNYFKWESDGFVACNFAGCSFRKKEFNPTNLEQHLARAHSSDDSGIWEEYSAAKEESKKKKLDMDVPQKSASTGMRIKKLCWVLKIKFPKKI